jgi:ribosomal protein L32
MTDKLCVTCGVLHLNHHIDPECYKCRVMKDAWQQVQNRTQQTETTKETNMSNNYNQQTDIDQIARIATLTSDVNRLTLELEKSEAGWAASEVEWVSIQNRSTENFQSLKKHNKNIFSTVRNFIIEKAADYDYWIDENSEFIDAMIDLGMDGLQKTVTVSRTYTVSVEVTAKVDWDWDGSDEDSYIDLELDEDDIGGSLLENCNDSDIEINVSERYSERSCDITTDTDK